MAVLALLQKRHAGWQKPGYAVASLGQGERVELHVLHPRPAPPLSASPTRPGGTTSLSSCFPGPLNLAFPTPWPSEDLARIAFSLLPECSAPPPPARQLYGHGQHKHTHAAGSPAASATAQPGQTDVTACPCPTRRQSSAGNTPDEPFSLACPEQGFRAATVTGGKPRPSGRRAEPVSARLPDARSAKTTSG